MPSTLHRVLIKARLTWRDMETAQQRLLELPPRVRARPGGGRRADRPAGDS